jgi:hypothetical protein
MTTRRAKLFVVGYYYEGLNAATAPRRSSSCCTEPSGEGTEDRAIGTCGSQEDTDAGGGLNHPSGDLDQTKAQRRELCR